MQARACTVSLNPVVGGMYDVVMGYGHVVHTNGVWSIFHKVLPSLPTWLPTTPSGASQTYSCHRVFCFPSGAPWHRKRFSGDLRRGFFLSQKMHPSVTTNILLLDMFFRCDTTKHWKLRTCDGNRFLYVKTQKRDRAPRWRWLDDGFFFK